MFTVARNEHEKQRLLTSGFNPDPSASPDTRPECLLKFSSRLQWRDRIRFSRISVFFSQVLIKKNQRLYYHNHAARQHQFLRA